MYAYTPDLAGDTSAERERLAELLSDAGAGTKRFIDVHNGQKGSFDTGNARYPDDPEIEGNYGVKGGRGGDESGKWLVDIKTGKHERYNGIQLAGYALGLGVYESANRAILRLKNDGTYSFLTKHKSVGSFDSDLWSSMWLSALNMYWWNNL